MVVAFGTIGFPVASELCAGEVVLSHSSEFAPFDRCKLSLRFLHRPVHFLSVFRSVECLQGATSSELNQVQFGSVALAKNWVTWQPRAAATDAVDFPRLFLLSL